MRGAVGGSFLLVRVAPFVAMGGGSREVGGVLLPVGRVVVACGSPVRVVSGGGGSDDDPVSLPPSPPLGG